MAYPMSNVCFPHLFIILALSLNCLNGCWPGMRNRPSVNWNAKSGDTKSGDSILISPKSGRNPGTVYLFHRNPGTVYLFHQLLVSLRSVNYEKAEEERAFMRAMVTGLADLEAGHEVSLDETRKRLGLK